ncbi:MAG TPA: Gfo/Idh/MocA family oxidoreductase [Phycisphaerae bacterium]|nr:Gfo/Idh/MocA family oxidoreductase [Phycisphaerae bacterium]HRY67776.1 Gfo/Idh/MocA family oxidoreductase [Phycisphaerae bacterium]HSA25228.1 Gfo/Idh/MocA family oxidoreductase [Phycisphaerae bacterium]
MNTNRRDFLKASAAAGMAMVAGPALRAAEPGKKYSLALIGSGWWGGNILREALASGECRLAAICDCDTNQMDRTRRKIEQLTADTPKPYVDFRELLAREKPEIVINATPDHWHALITMEALKAGAHVYVEKPISHTIKEGRAMVNAARAADRVVQVGTHRRMSPHNIAGREFIQSGKAGKIGMIRSFVFYGGGPEKPEPNAEPPKGMDWDLYCGPAPLRPFNPLMHPRGFRSFLDFANGQLGDWGIHWLDQVLWVMDRQYPRRVFSAGGRPIKGPVVNTPEAQTSDAPDHQVSTFDFGDLTLVWEHRQFAGNNAEKTHPGQPVGCFFYGTEGTFHMGWLDGWTFYPADMRKPTLHQDAQLHEPDQQNIKELWANFLACIKSGKRPVCDIEIGHRSTTMALLGMLSLKHGKSIQWDGEKETIVGDEAANKLLFRPYRSPWVYPGT